MESLTLFEFWSQQAVDQKMQKQPAYDCANNATFEQMYLTMALVTDRLIALLVFHGLIEFNCLSRAPIYCVPILSICHFYGSLDFGLQIRHHHELVLVQLLPQTSPSPS